VDDARAAAGDRGQGLLVAHQRALDQAGAHVQLLGLPLPAIGALLQLALGLSKASLNPGQKLSIGRKIGSRLSQTGKAPRQQRQARTAHSGDNDKSGACPRQQENPADDETAAATCHSDEEWRQRSIKPRQPLDFSSSRADATPLPRSAGDQPPLPPPLVTPRSTIGP